MRPRRSPQLQCSEDLKAKAFSSDISVHAARTAPAKYSDVAEEQQQGPGRRHCWGGAVRLLERWKPPCPGHDSTADMGLVLLSLGRSLL